MNLFKYFLFYLKLTERKLLVVMLLSMTATVFETFALAAIATVTQYGNPDGKANKVASFIYPLIKELGVSNPKYIFILLLIIAAVAFTFTKLFHILNDWLIVRLYTSLYMKIQKNIMDQLINVKYEYFISQEIGHFNNVFITQLLALATSFKCFAVIIVGTFSVIPFLIMPFCMDPSIALILCVTLAPLIIPIRLINRKTKKYSIKIVQVKSNLNSIIIQILTQYKYLKATQSHSSVISQLRIIVNRFAKVTRKMVMMGSLSTHGLLPLALCILCCLVYWQVAVLEKPLIDAAFILGLLYMASTRINTFPISYQKFLTASGSILLYENMLNELAINQEQKDKNLNLKTADFSGSIRFENVGFSYQNSDQLALHDISLTISKCSSVAFVGGSGSGKSTLVNMIAGLLTPSSGRILLSESDYNEINLLSLRKGIGYVTQEPVIFSDTVANNIALWNNDYSEENVKEAAYSAHAMDFIEKLPDGYKTLLGDNGVNISGGQRQRISIAREFLRETPLLILDEATSALDSETEQVIQQSIDEQQGEKTMIIIAHRLSTIKKCDGIFVLDQGRIIESGSYNELISKKGLFKDMVDRQSL